jgi:hypothetical protein
VIGGWNNGGRRFWHGFAAGLALGAVFLGIGLSLLFARGLVVEVDAKTIASMVRTKVAEQARIDLAKAIVEIQKKVPHLVESQMKRTTLAASIQISGVTIPIPKSATGELEEHLHKTVESSLVEILKRIDVQSLAAKMGDDSGDWVYRALERDFTGKVFAVQPWRGVTLPVTVVVRE